MSILELLRGVFSGIKASEGAAQAEGNPFMESKARAELLESLRSDAGFVRECEIRCGQTQTEIDEILIREFQKTVA